MDSNAWPEGAPPRSAVGTEQCRCSALPSKRSVGRHPTLAPHDLAPLPTYLVSQDTLAPAPDRLGLTRALGDSLRPTLRQRKGTSSPVVRSDPSLSGPD